MFVRANHMPMVALYTEPDLQLEAGKPIEVIAFGATGTVVRFPYILPLIPVLSIIVSFIQVMLVPAEFSSCNLKPEVVQFSPTTVKVRSRYTLH
jgi:hypothetical protein